MNGRTCQLCGKPLSKIWAGSGGDFCSREHRNQYRLRCGMDTLLEANKHASLMRRRDQLRQFPTAKLQCDSAIAPRIFGPASATTARPELRSLPVKSQLANAKIESGDEHFLAPEAPGGLRGRLAAQSRPAAKTNFYAAGRLMPLPARRRQMPVTLPHAEVVAIRFRSNMGSGSRRSFTLLAQISRRTSLSGRAFRPLELEPLGSIVGKRARVLTQAAKEGHAFFVSSSNGFRLPAVKLRLAMLAPPAAKGMTWPGSLNLPAAAYIGQAIEPYPTALSLPIGAVQPPASRKLPRPAGLQLARARELPRRAAYEIRLDKHPANWIRQSTEGRPEIIESGLRAGQKSVGPGCVALKLVPAAVAVENRLERAPFQPQEQAWINISYSWNARR